MRLLRVFFQGVPRTRFKCITELHSTKEIVYSVKIREWTKFHEVSMP